MDRTIELSVNQNLGHDFLESKVFKDALYYGMMWGNSDNVRIFVDRHNNIGCSHERRQDDGTYKQFFYMEGIYHKSTNEYSFHS